MGLDATAETAERPAAPETVALVEEALSYAHERDYRGWDYADGMSSRLLRALPVENKWVNLAVQETVKRFPLNVRPLFLVEQRRNYKGTALFAMANMTAGDLVAGDHPTAGPAGADPDAAGQGGPGRPATARSAADRTAGGQAPAGLPGGTSHDEAARSLLDWLVDNSIEGYEGFCVCHPHDLQTLDGVVPVGTPGVVGTSYGVKALLRADARFGGEYAATARTAADFLFEDLGYREVDDGAVIDYKPTDSGEYHTVNAVALGARLLVDLHARFDEPRFREAATELLRYVAARQTDLGGWYYRDPPEASHLSMDNHHNGFVIEAFQRYRAVTGDDRFDDTLESALAFYRNVLFAPSGAPNFDEESPFPRDVHASAQGILVFTYAGDREFARRIADWTREQMYLGGGRFVSRKHRYHTKRHVLMRWCVGWMAYALSEFARAPDGAAEPFDDR